MSLSKFRQHSAGVIIILGLAFSMRCGYADNSIVTDTILNYNFNTNVSNNGGVLVHKWDGQGAFGESIAGSQGHPEDSISSSIVSSEVINTVTQDEGGCKSTICTYVGQYSSGVIYNLPNLLKKYEPTTYGGSPILCGFVTDGMTDFRPSRAGCGISSMMNTWCGVDYYNPISAVNHSTIYWPENDCTGYCKSGLKQGEQEVKNCVGNALPYFLSAQTTDVGIFYGTGHGGFPFYPQGSRASYNFNPKFKQVYTGGLMDVLSKIQELTSDVCKNTKGRYCYNEILLDAGALKNTQTGGGNNNNLNVAEPYDWNYIYGWFIDGTEDQTKSIKELCGFIKHYGKDSEAFKLPVFTLNDNATPMTDKFGRNYYLAFTKIDNAHELCKSH